MEAKKVNVEVIGKKGKISDKKPWSIFFRIKIAIAIMLDGIDILIAWIPIVNTAWDFITFIILLLILKNKKLAFVSLIELPLFGLPPFSIFDMFIPIATVTVLIDNSLADNRIKNFKN